MDQTTGLTTTSLISDAERDHRIAGLDFGYYLDGYINGFEEEPETYFLKGPDFIIMAYAASTDPDTGEPRPHWHIHYLATVNKNKLDVLFQWMPYHLPEMSFARTLKNDLGLRFYKTDRLLKLCQTFHKSSDSSSGCTLSATSEAKEKLPL